MASLEHITVIAPHFKRRLSGVTSTVVQLVPEQVRHGRGIVTLGPGLPEYLPKMRWRDLPNLWQRPRGSRARIWHARRNNEMLVGLILKIVFRMPLKLLFTSAAQRNHSGYTKWLLRQMDGVVATSQRSGAFLEVPHTVIRHGVDLSVFHPPEGPDDLISSTTLPGKYLIGCFGRVRNQKGTDLFVRAMIELLPHYPDWTAVVCGRVTKEHQEFARGLQASVAKAGLSDRICFLGEVDDVKPWYRRLTLYVAPSRNEGFGLTPLEAMASQTAVVASDAGAYAEMIMHGKSGMVVAAGAYEPLRDAINHYFSEPNSALKDGHRALGYVRDNFSLAREAEALERVYSTLIGV